MPRCLQAVSECYSNGDIEGVGSRDKICTREGLNRIESEPTTAPCSGDFVSAGAAQEHETRGKEERKMKEGGSESGRGNDCDLERIGICRSLSRLLSIVVENAGTAY
jgi:hypothetical protein